MECFRRSIDDPVAIRAVKRFAALFEREEKLKPATPNITSTKKVAIVGSGPAGIAAAYKLIQNGLKPVIFEKTSHIGGMLSWAIPDFRLPRDILKYEISVLKGLGIEFKTNQNLGNNLTISSLKERGFEAIILAIGTTQGKKVELEGAKNFKAHLDCLKFLSLINQGVKPDLGKSVAVIGGGNAAIDTARVLKRSGVDKVTVVYRRPEGQMPADNEEVMEAKSEGILFRFSSLPTALSKDNNHWNLSGFETKSPDRHTPVEVLKDKPFSLPITGIISAISQVPETSWAQAEGIALNPDGTLQVDDSKTSATDVYGAGDCVTGPSTVVEAMASGYNAAEAVLGTLIGDKRN